MSMQAFPRLPRQDDELVIRMPLQPHSAYIAYILPAEDQAIENESSKRQTTISRERRNIRILGGFLLEPVNELACHRLSAEIKTCQGSHEKLVSLGQFYYDNYIRHFKSAAEPTPRTSAHPSRPSFDRVADEIEPQLVPTPQNHSKAKKRIDVAKGLWAVLTRFGYPTAWIELNGNNCHRLCNLLTLSTLAHEQMDKLDLWFESTSTPNTYYVKTHPPDLLEQYKWPAQVTFTVRNDLDIPGLGPPKEGLGFAQSRLPCASRGCCKVAHMAGAAEPLEDSIFHDPESHRVLAQDGGSADLLFDELSCLADPV
ncbi:uncharacterized protein BXZ73DRAFT_97786 [Epithele typhae]|uniref:uncharacterized protein n=1 Tax=Epithele typhae TaxID=378194 RepID=UPI0020072A51|nr:uncharacterized protein BXZ73DRAFT_97786 [Epithele typhae]KAH9942372.1 hypothetical protein BXZ73DRAFT_97786 [Epithele typhae]